MILNRYEVEFPDPADRGAEPARRRTGRGHRAGAIARAWVALPELEPAEAAVAAARQSGDPLARDERAGCVRHGGRRRGPVPGRAARQPRSGSRWRRSLPAPRSAGGRRDRGRVSTSPRPPRSSVGDLTEAVRLAGLTDDPVHGHPYITAPRKIRAFALSGLFDEAVRGGGRDVERLAGSRLPAARLDGLGRVHRRAGPRTARHRPATASGRLVPWRSPAWGIRRTLRTLMAAAAFVDARLALHRLDTGRSRPGGKGGPAGFRGLPRAVVGPVRPRRRRRAGGRGRLPDAERYLERAVDGERLVGRRTAAGQGPADRGPGRAGRGGGPVRADRGRGSSTPVRSALLSHR